MKLNLHPELLIESYRKGIKLVEPKNRLTPSLDVGAYFNMPLIIYFVDLEGAFIDANHLTRMTNIPNNRGYYSDADLKKTKLSSIFCKKTVNNLCLHNEQVASNHRMLILNEPNTRLDEFHFSTLTFKFPVYDNFDNVIAVFGMSALFDNDLYKEAEPLTTAIDRIINTGLINISSSQKSNLLKNLSFGNGYLSQQEIRCLRLLISGKTYKLIGEHLQLSPRTVEHYIENIKQKLNVKTRSELIENVIQQFWPDILF